MCGCRLWSDGVAELVPSTHDFAYSLAEVEGAGVCPAVVQWYIGSSWVSAGEAQGPGGSRTNAKPTIGRNRRTSWASAGIDARAGHQPEQTHELGISRNRPTSSVPAGTDARARYLPEQTCGISTRAGVGAVSRFLYKRASRQRARRPEVPAGKRIQRRRRG
jgi:hypothetical protein